MCGIAGIIPLNKARPVNLSTLQQMCNTLVHRGPDEEGLHIQDGIGIGMRRLSIIDVTGGHQPYFNEDQSVRAVFNGEIYNYRELKSWLGKNGHHYNSSSDGEVIVHLWEEQGVDFLNDLNGMFAIALHDGKQGEFLLARDRIGIKPLFYSITDNYLIFGSEIKAILASGLIEHALNFDALGQFLSWEYVPGKSTLFKGIYKLEPASYLKLDLKTQRIEINSWWDIPMRENAEVILNPYDQFHYWQQKIDNELETSVKRRLISDVPLGAFLSGGVDSSLITAGMGPAKTFSIGFDDPSYNELEWSKKVAQHLGCDHRTEIIRPDIIELFDHLMNFMDDPIGDFSIFPTYLVSKLARQEVTVALSGDGGDELFGGYEAYLAQKMSKKWTSVPSPIQTFMASLINSIKPQKQKKGLINKAKRFIEGVEHHDSLAHARWRLFLNEYQRQSLLTEEALDQMSTSVEDHIFELFKRTKNRSEIDQWLYVDLKSYLCDNILVKVDRMSMACSLEARVPYLDHEFVELVFQMPPEFKLFKNQTKYILKKIAEKKVPRECVYRPKEGFSIPIKNWLSNEFLPLVEELLDPTKLKNEGIFQVQKLNQFKEEHFSGKANHSHILWAMLVFQDWRQRWKV